LTKIINPSQAEGSAEFKLRTDAWAAIMKQSEFLWNRKTFLQTDELMTLQQSFSDDELFSGSSEVDAVVAHSLQST
jgi:hypothetical protein